MRRAKEGKKVTHVCIVSDRGDAHHPPDPTRSTLRSRPGSVHLNRTTSSPSSDKRTQLSRKDLWQSHTVNRDNMSDAVLPDDDNVFPAFWDFVVA